MDGQSFDQMFPIIDGQIFAAPLSEMDGFFRDVPFYSEALSAFREGSGTAQLRKRFMLKAIDEAWVCAIEDALPSLDTIIRNPGMSLVQEESVLPIEQTKKVTSRSVQHLSQHTDYINEISSDGMVRPSKLLNVYQDETIFTYENKFINTLLNYLYGFVSRRYQSALKQGEDKKETTFELTREFACGEEQSGKITVTVQFSEKPQEKEVIKNKIYTTDLWRRVERINTIVNSYMNSPFARRMGHAMVHPPIMRTNKILKNVDFRQCLALWEFMEQYDNTGYEMLIQEDLETVSDECIEQFYQTLSLQYALFRKHIKGEFEKENALDQRRSDQPLAPRFKDELDAVDEREFDQTYDNRDNEKLSESDEEIEQAILVALEADRLFFAEEADAEEEAVMDKGEVLYRYRHSFTARLIYAQDPTQSYYTAIKNELLSYEDVRSKVSWNHDAFSIGRHKCARLNVRGKTLFLYLPLSPAAYPQSKYHHTDLSGSKKFGDLPFLLKIRSPRGEKYAKELIAEVMQIFGVARLESPVTADYHLPYAEPAELAKREPALVKVLEVKDGSGKIPEKKGAPADAPAIVIEPFEGMPPEVLELPESEEPAELPAVSVPDEAESAEALPEKEEKPAAPADVSKFTSDFSYRYSFLARLIQSPQDVQDLYGEVKNYLLSYPGVKAKISWGYEAFRIGKEVLVRINMRGKGMTINYALDPNGFDPRYRLVDQTGQRSAGGLPAMLRVKSSRGVRYACELVDALMQKNGLTQGEIPQVDYRMPYQNTEELLHQDPPLVKRT